jgi:hypothetical protein
LTNAAKQRSLWISGLHPEGQAEGQFGEVLLGVLAYLLDGMEIAK